jgi:hypothetical protein
MEAREKEGRGRMEEGLTDPTFIIHTRDPRANDLPRRG